jgi:FdhD protein
MVKLPNGAILQTLIKVTGKEIEQVEEAIAEEIPLTVYLNGQELITMLASPGDENYLVVGLLASEGIIQNIKDIQTLEVDTQQGIIQVSTISGETVAEKLFLKRYLSACCGKGRSSFYFTNDILTARQVESRVLVSAEAALAYSDMLENMSTMYRLTHGVHSGALADNGQLICYSQDIGRHNVFDKIYGRCLLEGITVADKMIVFSGRVSSEIILKVSKMAIPVIVSRSAPTSLALDLADELGITVVGFAKGGRLKIYTHTHRIQIQANPAKEGFE